MNYTKIKIALYSCFFFSWTLTAQTATVSGTITGAKTNITIQLTGTNLSMSTAVDGQGNYSFLGVPVGIEITITPTKEDSPLNGITTLDHVLGLKHILAIDLFEIADKYIAMDLNKSGTVTGMDLVIMRRLILGIITEIPNNQAWIFVEETQLKAINFAGFSYTGEFNTSFIISADTPNIFNFVGIKTGDLNENAIP